VLQRGTWSIYCRCKRSKEIHTYEVDNEARQQALGLLAWQEEYKKSLIHPSAWKGNSKEFATTGFYEGVRKESFKDSPFE
jgi:hypothetical protein